MVPAAPRGKLRHGGSSQRDAASPSPTLTSRHILILSLAALGMTQPEPRCPTVPGDPHVQTSSPGSFPGPGSKGNKPHLFPAGPNPPAAPRGPGLGRILPWHVGGEQTRLYARCLDPGEGMKSPSPASNQAFLGRGTGVVPGWGHRAGCAGCRKRIPAPKPTQVFLNPSHGLRADSGRCCQQLKIVWEGGTETRARLEEEEDKGQNHREEESGRGRGPGSTAAMPGPIRKRCHAPTTSFTFPQGQGQATGLFSFGVREEKSRLRHSPQGQSLRTRTLPEKPVTTVLGPMHWVFFPASHGAADEEQHLEMAPKPTQWHP